MTHQQRVLEAYERMAAKGVSAGIEITKDLRQKAIMYRVIGLVAGWLEMTEETRDGVELEDDDILLALSVAIYVAAETHMEHEQSA